MGAKAKLRWLGETHKEIKCGEAADAPSTVTFGEEASVEATQFEAHVGHGEERSPEPLLCPVQTNRIQLDVID